MTVLVLAMMMKECRAQGRLQTGMRMGRKRRKTVKRMEQGAKVGHGCI
jgi:hypothetical protein